MSFPRGPILLYDDNKFSSLSLVPGVYRSLTSIGKAIDGFIITSQMDVLLLQVVLRNRFFFPPHTVLKVATGEKHNLLGSDLIDHLKSNSTSAHRFFFVWVLHELNFSEFRISSTTEASPFVVTYLIFDVLVSKWRVC